MTSSWLYTPTAKRVFEVRLDSGYAQAPTLRNRSDLTYRSQSVGLGAEISLTDQISITAHAPWVATRSGRDEQVFFHRQTLGDLNVGVRYRLSSKWAIMVGASIPGALDDDAAESYPLNKNPSPNLGLIRHWCT